MALKKMCSCGKLIDYTEKHCEECTNKLDQLNKQRHKQNKASRKDKKEQELYTSTLWVKVKEEAKIKTYGIDAYEYYINNRVVSGEVVHHIVEVKEDWSKRLDISNLIYITNSTHRHIHNVYSKSNEERKQMQNILYELLDRFNKEFKSNYDYARVGGIKKF